MSTIMRRVRLRAAALAGLVLVGCTGPATTSPSPAITPTPSLAPTPSAAPTLVRGIALIPPLVARAQYGDLRIALDIPDRIGQPAEDIVWRVDPFRADAGYAARVAAALGLGGTGTLGLDPGRAPIATGPWRLWLDAKVLAVNEDTGVVYFFDPSANDGPALPGPARRDPAEAFRLVLGTLGWSADLSPTVAGVTAFRGTEVAARADPIIPGAWLEPGYRETAVLFPRYPHPDDPTHLPGPHVYDTDHIALLTAKGRPAEIIHRPMGVISGREVYPITSFGAARSELLGAPQRYLRFLSNPTGEALTLSFVEAYMGSAWAIPLAGGPRLLVPAWIFVAKGTTASGLPVDAIFVVDAVVPEMRIRGSTGGVGRMDADVLLGYQLATLGGLHSELLTARGAAMGFLGATCEPTFTTQDADSATGTIMCGGPTISLTVKRAFPGLRSSIWFLAEARK